AAVDGYERLIRPRALEMNRFRDQFFSCTAFALNQNRASAYRDLRDKIEHPENLFALSNDVAVAEPGLQCAPQLQVFAHQLPLLDRVRHDDDQLFIVPGLRDVIEGSFFDSR